MGFWAHSPGDPPATYVYKIRIQRYCVQILLMTFSILPLIYVVPKTIFQARFHTVNRVEVTAKALDLSTGNTTMEGYRVMQFDESLELLQAQKLCATADEKTTEIERNPKDCSSFHLAPETSIQFCAQKIEPLKTPPVPIH